MGTGFLRLFSTSKFSEVLFSSSCLILCLVLVLADIVTPKSTTFITCTTLFPSLVSSCHILCTFCSCCTHLIGGGTSWLVVPLTWLLSRLGLLLPSWLCSGIHLLWGVPSWLTGSFALLLSWLWSGIHLLGGVPSWLTGSFAWLLSKL